MNMCIAPSPAPEELALGYVPSSGSCEIQSISARMTIRGIATFYALLLLVMITQPAEGMSRDTRSDVATTAALAELSCADCSQTPLPPIRN